MGDAPSPPLVERGRTGVGVTIKADDGRLAHLDGVRALAVIAVLGAHEPIVRLFSAGYLGVTAFFVLSGYLITKRLLADYEAHGRIRRRHFYFRRVCRLMPALLAVVAASLVLGWVLAPAGAYGRVVRDAVLSLTYTTDIATYFPSFLKPTPQVPHLLGHTWSLAIEEQFYLAYPALLGAAMSGRHLKTRKRVGIVCLLITVMSWSTLWGEAFVSRVPGSLLLGAYFHLECRIGEIALGCAIALLVPEGGLDLRKNTRSMVEVLLIASAAILLWAVSYQPSAILDYAVGIPVLAVIAATAITLMHSRDSMLRKMLAWRPFTEIGLRSYGVYLYHLPIFVAFPALLHAPLRITLPVMLLATGAAAEASYRWIETPVLRWSKKDLRHLWTFGMATTPPVLQNREPNESVATSSSLSEG